MFFFYFYFLNFWFHLSEQRVEFLCLFIMQSNPPVSSSCSGHPRTAFISSLERTREILSFIWIMIGSTIKGSRCPSLSIIISFLSFCLSKFLHQFGISKCGPTWNYITIILKHNNEMYKCLLFVSQTLWSNINKKQQQKTQRTLAFKDKYI